MVEAMIGARVMLAIVIINFITLLVQGETQGGKVVLEQNMKTLLSYVFLIVVLFYFSFKDFSK